MSRPGRVMIVVVLVVLAALAVAYLDRREQSLPGAEPTVAASHPRPAADSAVGDEAETRRLAMQVAYADLEKDRLLLNRQLGSLNASLWDRRMPAARAQAIQSDMMSAKTLLTNPPLLGAFRDAAAIRHEQERVNAALTRLQAIESELRADGSG